MNSQAEEQGIIPHTKETTGHGFCKSTYNGGALLFPSYSRPSGNVFINCCAEDVARFFSRPARLI
jgi:hypothetical protein